MTDPSAKKKRMQDDLESCCVARKTLFLTYGRANHATKPLPPTPTVFAANRRMRLYERIYITYKDTVEGTILD